MKIDPKTKLCPCGRIAVKRHAGGFSCQRCIDWDAKIYGTTESRGVAGVRRFIKRGQAPIMEEAQVYA